MRVAVGRLNFENTVSQFKDGNIKGTAAKVIYSDGLFLVLILVEAECKRCSGRLVDDALDVKAGNLACILGCLALGIIEICRNGDDSFRHLLAKVILSGLLHLLQGEGRDFLRAVFLL